MDEPDESNRHEEDRIVLKEERPALGRDVARVLGERRADARGPGPEDRQQAQRGLRERRELERPSGAPPAPSRRELDQAIGRAGALASRRRAGQWSPGAALLALGLIAAPSWAQSPVPEPIVSPETMPSPSPTAAQPTSPDTERSPSTNILGKTGIEVTSEDGRHSLHLWFRGQMRYSTPFDSPPRTPEAFGEDPIGTFNLRRVRLKVGGTVYRKWLGYYFEHDLKSNALLDLRFTLAPRPGFRFRVGQWKANFTRERVDSSGRQQFVERSIVNREFTVDRQPGLMVFGHLWRGSRADSWYYAGLFNGNGRNENNDDTTMMWLARYQWNFLARDLSFRQSDVEFHQKPTGSVAFAVVGNRSPYTRFSSSGGGQLDGFDRGETGQYELLQYAGEAAFKYRGFSFQNEFHWKEVDDTVNATLTKLRGGYVQAGYFPWGGAARPIARLEFAARYAWVDPNVDVRDDDRREMTLAANFFFAGHDNKLTADFSRLELDEAEGPTLSDHRFRFQWDISF